MPNIKAIDLIVFREDDRKEFPVIIC